MGEDLRHGTVLKFILCKIKRITYLHILEHITGDYLK